jgi:hypothetical protein
MQDDFKIYNFIKKDLEINQVKLAIRGIMSQDVLSIAGHTIRNAIKEPMLSKRVFGVVIELAQNIHHYSDEKEFCEDRKRPVGCGIIAVSNYDGYYFISSGNKISREKAEAIAEKCNKVNSLSEDELKQHYKELRRKQRHDHVMGGNVGFVDLARKSENKLKLDFFDTDEADMVFFVLGVTVSKDLFLNNKNSDE